MSNLSEELERQMAEATPPLSVDDVSERSGISRTLIYEWKNGVKTKIVEDQMNALALSLSGDPFKNAALVRAHLLDEKFGPSAELVHVEILGGENQANDKPRRKTDREIVLEYFAKLSLESPTVLESLKHQARALGAELSNSPGRAGARQIVAAVYARARNATNPSRPPAPSSSRKVRPPSKKPPSSGHNAT